MWLKNLGLCEVPKIESSWTRRVLSEDDIYYILSLIRALLPKWISEMDQQKVLVAASELMRNILDHANGQGSVDCELLEQGMRLTVTDKGPGISNLHEALSGVKTERTRGLGLGLSGVQRLMDELHIQTSQRGTTIVAIKWFTEGRHA